MPRLSEQQDPCELGHRLCDARTVTAELMSEVIAKTCRRFPSFAEAGKTARLERLIRSAAWTDAVLGLIEIELPLWKVRRIVYDEGEWHCALSRERELPEWLDRSVETSHPDLALALLSAFADAQRLTESPGRTSVPTVPCAANALDQPACCDNFA